MSDPLLSAVDHFFTRWQAQGEATRGLALRPWEAQWRSACEVSEAVDGQVAWRPYRRAQGQDFSVLEQALSLRFPAALQAFYGHWYSAPIVCLYKGLKLELLFAWNDEDLALLQQNLIGHVLMLNKLKRSPSLFIASTRNEMVIIVIENDTGHICCEWLDSGKRVMLAPDLGQFLARLVPLYD